MRLRLALATAAFLILPREARLGFTGEMAARVRAFGVERGALPHVDAEIDRVEEAGQALRAAILRKGGGRG